MECSDSPWTPWTPSNNGLQPTYHDFSPDSAIEKTLSSNQFLQAAASQFYVTERPTSWDQIPHFAENTLACPPPTRVPTAAAESYFDSGYASSYIAPRNSTPFEALNCSKISSPSGNMISSDCPVDSHSTGPSEVKSEIRYANESRSDKVDYRKPLIVTSVPSPQKDEVSSPTTETSGMPFSRAIPPGFTTQRVCSQPVAYLLKHDNNEDGILLSPDGKVQPYIQTPKRNSAKYFATLAKSSQIPYCQPAYTSQPVVHPNSYEQQPPIYYEPVQELWVTVFPGTSRPMPQLKDEVIPRIDLSGYSNILHLPTDPSEVLIYFNSICGAANLSEIRRFLIEDNIQGTGEIFNLLDDCIFQMCDAINTKRLWKEEGDLVYDFATDVYEGKIIPSSTMIKNWRNMVKSCRDHLTGLGNLGYGLVLSKCKVEAVRAAIVQFKDRWENEIFSGCINEDWEAWSDDLEIMKEYNTFNREIQRLVKGVEDDLLLVGRLENMTMAFGKAVFKAEMKLWEVERKHQLGAN
ncbi:hypothetical protein TWF694_007654 [Orbilia ellipsospora]